MPKQFVPPVEASSVGAQKPFHPRHQISPRCFQHHMKVIGHQAQGMHLPAGLAASFAQGVYEPLPIRVIPENGFAPVAPIHHVVNGTGIFHSELARHGAETIHTALIWQYQELTRFRLRSVFPPTARERPVLRLPQTSSRSPATSSARRDCIPRRLSGVETDPRSSRQATRPLRRSAI